MNTLEMIIPAAPTRKVIYRVFAFIGLVMGATQVAFASLSVESPPWFVASLAVYAFLGGSGFVMADNRTQGRTPKHAA